MTAVERWLPIDGARCYEISSRGQVKCVVRTQKRGPKPPYFMKPSDDGGGYLQVRFIVDNGDYVCRKIHRLVALAFLQPPNFGDQCNHIDGNKRNNELSNLEWVTHRRNCQHAYDIGIHKALRSTDHPHAKLTYESADVIREKYKTGEFTQWELARMFHVSQAVIHRVVTHKGYKTLPIRV